LTPAIERRPGRRRPAGILAAAAVSLALLASCATHQAGSANLAPGQASSADLVSDPATVASVLDQVVGTLLAARPGSRAAARAPHGGAVAAGTVWLGAAGAADVEIYPDPAALARAVDAWRPARGTLGCLQIGPTALGTGATWSVATTDTATAALVDGALIPLGDGGFLRVDDRPSPLLSLPS